MENKECFAMDEYGAYLKFRLSSYLREKNAKEFKDKQHWSLHFLDHCQQEVKETFCKSICPFHLKCPEKQENIKKKERIFPENFRA
jgi:hypothetical protein